MQIAQAYQFGAKNMHVYPLKKPARHDIPQYALQIAFKALVNAVAHRDYSIRSSKVRLRMFSDRLEIFSPGTTPNTMKHCLLDDSELTLTLFVASLPACRETCLRRIVYAIRSGCSRNC